jgi:5-methylthioadenosine/S-adenosylhomocysteine deaminase
MMDAGDDVPARLREHTKASIDESVALGKRWDGAGQGRLRAAFAPRFALSCSPALLEAVASLSDANQTLVHTHASESRDEIAMVRRLSGGLANIEYLAGLRLASPRLCCAHCVWADDREQGLLAEHDVKVLHCPSSNLKLGSGIAPVAAMRARGINVSLGADGAACNNHLDMFTEMRLAALLQAVTQGPGALTARDALAMATRGGATALGLDADIGSIEAGKHADLIVIDRDRPHLLPGLDPYSTIVYAARATDVSMTIVDGEVLVRHGRPVRVDLGEITADARAAARELTVRAGV